LIYDFFYEEGNNMDEQMLNVNKKTLGWQRFAALMVLATFMVILVTALILVPQIVETLNNINKVAGEVEQSLQGVDTMVAEMTSASENLNKLVDDNAQGLTTAVENLANVDFDGLNKAIQDLQDAIGPMATFFNKFK
jgi:predicted PurR-regulated permease PerM